MDSLPCLSAETSTSCAWLLHPTYDIRRYVERSKHNTRLYVERTKICVASYAIRIRRTQPDFYEIYRARNLCLWVSLTLSDDVFRP